MLIDLLLWLLASYGFAMLIAAVANRAVRSVFIEGEETSVSILVLLQNSAEQLEAVIRSLTFASRWTGQPIRIYLEDDGSTDDTLAMVAILKRNHPVVAEGEAAETALIVDLRIPYTR